MNARFALVLFSLGLASISSRAQSLIGSASSGVGELFGRAVVRAGDQNADGFEDLLVGGPGFNTGRGIVYCVSGKFLANGTAPVVLWQRFPTTVQLNAHFGSSIAMVGNLVGDSAPDIVVGAPGPAGARGQVMLLDGSTHAIVAIVSGIVQPLVDPYHIGQAVAAVGDQDGDGKTEIAIGAPGDGFAGMVFIVRGAALAQAGMNGNVNSLAMSLPLLGAPGFGTALAGGFDLNGDGRGDVAIGSPKTDQGTLLEAGQIFVISCPHAPSPFSAVYTSNIAGEHLGASLDCAHDYDGDGRVDFVVGAPESPGGLASHSGRVVVLSGAKMLANTAPKEMYVLYGGATGGFFGWRLGASVCSSPDLNHDGTADFIAGMPSYSVLAGGAQVFSGATGARIGFLGGASGDGLGDTVLGGFDDLDGDGFLDFAIAGSFSDNPTPDGGVVKCMRLFPVAPGTYCTAKPNSQGCFPGITFTGSPSVASSSAFDVRCSNLINNKPGILIYSHKPSATAFQGGFLCVTSTIKRVGMQSSGGSTTGIDCSGTFHFDFNAHIDSHADPSLVVGAEIFDQWWSRDPASPAGSSLSNALRFVINP
jgi:hypothetical protein